MAIGPSSSPTGSGRPSMPSASRPRRRSDGPVEQAVLAGDRQQHADAACHAPSRRTSRVPGSVGSREVSTRSTGRRGRSTSSSSCARDAARPRHPALVRGHDAAGARAARRAARASGVGDRRTWLDSRRCVHESALRRSATSVRLIGMPHDHQGRHPRRGPRHPLPARDQGDAEGDAARSSTSPPSSTSSRRPSRPASTTCS